MLFSRFRRKNNDLMVKKPSEEVLKAHNDAEIIIKENNIDRFLLNMFMDKKGINKFHTTPELVNEFLNSDWFLNLDLKCLLQINDESKRIRTNAYLTKKEIIFKEKADIKIKKSKSSSISFRFVIEYRRKKTWRLSACWSPPIRWYSAKRH